MTRLLSNMLLGAGQIFDFAGVAETRARREVMRRAKERSTMNVRTALRFDAEQLGRDMRKAMDTYRASRG